MLRLLAWLSPQALWHQQALYIGLKQSELFAHEPATLAAAAATARSAAAATTAAATAAATPAATCNVLWFSQSTDRLIFQHIRRERADYVCFAALWLLGAPDRQQLQQGCVEATFYVQDQQTTPILVPPAEVHGGQGILFAADVCIHVLSIFPGIAELD